MLKIAKQSLDDFVKLPYLELPTSSYSFTCENKPCLFKPLLEIFYHGKPNLVVVIQVQRFKFAVKLTKPL